MRDEWRNWLEPIRVLAAEASERILEIYATAFGVTPKGDDSPLTEFHSGLDQLLGQP